MSRLEDRYENLQIITLSNGKTVYRSCRPVNVVENTNDQLMVTDEEDRLDILASTVYGSPEDWWKLAALNKHVNGSLHTRPGTILRIPRRRT